MNKSTVFSHQQPAKNEEGRLLQEANRGIVIIRQSSVNSYQQENPRKVESQQLIARRQRDDELQSLTERRADGKYEKDSA